MKLTSSAPMELFLTFLSSELIEYIVVRGPAHAGIQNDGGVVGFLL